MTHWLWCEIPTVVCHSWPRCSVNINIPLVASHPINAFIVNNCKITYQRHQEEKQQINHLSHLSPLTLDVATLPFHHSLSSAALRESPNPIPVQSLMLSSHLFFCLPLLLAPFTVPCRIVFAMPGDLEMWPYHLSFRFFTMVNTRLRKINSYLCFLIDLLDQTKAFMQFEMKIKTWVPLRAIKTFVRKRMGYTT